MHYRSFYQDNYYCISYVSGWYLSYLQLPAAVFSAHVSSEFYELVGDASTADDAPKSADCSPSFFSQIMLHGIFMALAWGLFLPWGAFIARHMKHRAPLWFHLHRLFQVIRGDLCTDMLVCMCVSACSIVRVRAYICANDSNNNPTAPTATITQ